MLSQPVVDRTLAPVPLDAAAIALAVAIFLAVAWVARARPAVAIALLIAAVPFAFAREVGHTTLTLSKVALLAVVAGLVLGRADARVLLAPAARTLGALGLAVALATALSIAQAAHRGPALRETFKALEYLLLFLTVVVAARADGDERFVRSALAGSVAAVALTALAQEFTGAPSVMDVTGGTVARVAGALEGPNQLAGYLGLALPALLAFALARAVLPLERAALALGLTTLVLTISRAGVAASLAALAVVAAVTPTRRARTPVLIVAIAGFAAGVAALAALGVAIAGSPAGLAILWHFGSTAESAHPGSVGTRAQLWAAALTLWRAHPLLGIGAGNFEEELGLAGFPALHTHANSLYLQALVEGGLPLVAATVALLVASVVTFARGPFREPFVVAALAASVGFALHQAGDLLVFYPKVGELWWILLALGAARVDAARVDAARVDAARVDAAREDSSASATGIDAGRASAG